MLGTDTFEQFIANFTHEEYFVRAKKFRQVIFGNMNPKRQQKIQKYLIDKILVALLESGCFAEKDLRDYTSDEIVFECNVTSMSTSIMQVIEHVVQQEELDLHVDMYTLKWMQCLGDGNVSGMNHFFVREFDDGRVDFKGVENKLMPQVYKRYCGNSVYCKEDFLFYDSNGLIAQYVTPLEFV